MQVAPNYCTQLHLPRPFRRLQTRARYNVKVCMRLIVKESTSLRANHSEALESRSTRRGVVNLILVIVCETGSREPIAPNCTRAGFHHGKRVERVIFGAECRFNIVSTVVVDYPLEKSYYIRV